jgi:hypothetical protein
MSTSPASVPRRRPFTPFALVSLALVALALIVLAGRQDPSLAAEDGKVDILYLSVTNEGPTAKAWYEGAPSAGVPVQEALTKFGREGYKVVAVTEDLRSSLDATAIVVLLQREP